MTTPSPLPEIVDSVPSLPPRASMFDDAMNLAKEHPGEWVAIPGEHWYNMRTVLEKRGFLYEAHTAGPNSKKHNFWIKWSQ